MIIRTTPDKEKARSLFSMTEHREKFINSLLVSDDSATVITENYYEIIKELGTIILLVDGFKTIGEYAHKEIIEYLAKNKVLDSSEAEIADDLRTKRNYSSYEGRKISKAPLFYTTVVS